MTDGIVEARPLEKRKHFNQERLKYILALNGYLFLFRSMPEQHRDKRGLVPYMLSAASKNGALVLAKCGGCSPPRWYLPDDLIRLFGDIPAINLDHRMRCGKCGSLMSVRVTVPLAEERQKFRLRRLERVWWVRRVSWREE